jgi:hypothetical protein
MTLKTVQSRQTSAAAVAAELSAQLEGLSPRAILFFATPALNPVELGAELKREFGGVPSLGCTTAGELDSTAVLDGSVVLMACDADVVEQAAVAAVADVHRPESVAQALGQIAQQACSSSAEADPSHYLGLVLHDGLSGAEEAVMEALSSRTNIPFVGGSAGDGGKFERTHVFTNFVAQSGTSGLALLKLRRPYRILKTQSFRILDPVLTVTDADESRRTVRSFNGRPAAQEYARVLNTTVQSLPTYFRSHPVGLLIGNDEPYVRSPQQLRGTDVVFYCHVKPGMDLRLLESRDIVEDTERDLKRELAAMGACRGIINFNCILRTQELMQQRACEAYSALFRDIPAIGFSTYGESYIGHINQTATMVLFG